MVQGGRRQLRTEMRWQDCHPDHRFVNSCFVSRITSRMWRTFSSVLTRMQMSDVKYTSRKIYEEQNYNADDTYF